MYRNIYYIPCTCQWSVLNKHLSQICLQLVTSLLLVKLIITFSWCSRSANCFAANTCLTAFILAMAVVPSTVFLTSSMVVKISLAVGLFFGSLCRHFLMTLTSEWLGGSILSTHSTQCLRCSISYWPTRLSNRHCWPSFIGNTCTRN